MRFISKKTASILISTVVTMLVVPVYVFGQGNISFPDIENHWAKQSVITMADKKVINGYPDGTFRPEGKVTREELATMIALAFGISPPENNNVTYNDVGKERWSHKNIEAVKAFLPYRSKSDKGKFNPGKHATREEVAVSVVRAMQQSLSLPSVSLEKTFKDGQNISADYRRDVEKAIYMGFLKGDTDGRFRPKDPVTRAEMCTILKNVQLGKMKLERGPVAPILEAGIELQGETIVVSGKTDPGALVYVNNSSVKVNSDGSFKASLKLEGDSLQVDVVAVNEAGGRAKVSKKVDKKANTPRLEVTVPEITTTEIITLIGVTYPGSKVTINGEEIQANIYNGNFKKVMKLTPGTNTIIVNVTTPDGSELTVQKVVEFDNNQNTNEVIINVPDKTVDPNIIISGQVPKGCLVLLNGQKITTSTEGGFNYSIRLTQEITVFNFIVITPWGERYEMMRSVTWTASMPEIPSITPPEDSVLTEDP